MTPAPAGGEDARAQILAHQIYARGANRPFGELTAADVRARADELRGAVGWGPMARVAPVALAWRELATEMDRSGRGHVGELDAAVLTELAPRLWITFSGG